MNLRELLRRFNPVKLLKSGSLKNIMVLMSGTLLSQALPILFFPILSRIYSPADYGILGLFMSVSMLIMVVSNLQLNFAILIPKENNDALRVFSCGSYLVTGFSLLTLAGVIFFGTMLSKLLGSADLSGWLYLLPVTVFFSGINVQFSSWFNRSGKFKVISTSRILTSVVTISVSLGLSFLFKGPGGLIIAYLLGTVACFIVLLVAFLRDNNTLERISLAECKAILRTHRGFALYTMPTELMSNFAQQFPLYIFSMYSGVQSVGLFTRSRQMLALPINYISSSVSEVYKQKSSDAFRNAPESLRPLFIRTLKYLVLASVGPFLIIGLFSPALFAFFFGEKWRQAGIYSQCLVFLYFFKFVVSPLSFNFYLVNKQRLDFILHVIIMVSTSISLYAGFYFFHNDVIALILFSISYSSVYLAYGVYSYRFTFIKEKSSSLDIA